MTRRTPQEELEAAAIRAHGDPDAFGRVLSVEPEEPDVLVKEKCSSCERVLSVPSRDCPFVCGWCIEKTCRPKEDDENIAMVGPEVWCSKCETIQPCTEEQLADALLNKNFVCAECRSGV